MPETDLQKHAIVESFLQPNFSSKIWQILTMSDNLEFHKMTFCGLFIYCSIRIWKEILGQIVLSDPQDLEFNSYFVENMAFSSFRIVNNCVTPQVTETYERLKGHQKNNLEKEMWKCVGRISLQRHFLSFGFFPLASPSQSVLSFPMLVSICLFGDGEFEKL